MWKVFGCGILPVVKKYIHLIESKTSPNGKFIGNLHLQQVPIGNPHCTLTHEETAKVLNIGLKKIENREQIPDKKSRRPIFFC